MKLTNVFFTGLLLSLLMSSCLKNPGAGGSERNSGLPNVSGAAGEVLVVMDNNLWKGEGGNILRTSLEQEYPALPQPEPLFDVIHISSDAFDDLFKIHRTILIADVSSANTNPEVKYFENIWARPQLVVRMLAPDYNSFNKLVADNADRIIYNLQKYDRKRLADVYRNGKDLTIKALLAKFGVDLAIPRGYNVDINTDNFASMSIETSQTSQVIFIYRYPYYGKNDFTTERLIEKRNEFLKKYTVGTRTGSYMTTADIFPPIAYDLKIDGEDVVELRGLWELHKGYMGGPFISHSTLDKTRNEIVTVEAYVYNPNNKKRNLMRQMEAIVYSLKLLN
ncbi:MAG: DUF4837 family protein [Bacteroidales bacterium]|nr:DUF4837 family protein [Bacteroidales bacterium]MCB8999220.1 DUF4837 family protein [Bacteroidales bacterium]